MRQKNRYLPFISLILFLLVFLGWAVNSKWVVDFLFQFNDPETEMVYTPNSGPLQYDQTLVDWKTLKLSNAIEQPSGVAVQQGQIMLTTDKAEFLALDALGNLQQNLQLNHLPLLLRQGFAEGVACLGLQQCYVAAGEFRLFEVNYAQGDWQLEEFLSLQDALPADKEVQGLAINPETQKLYVAFIHEEQIQVREIDIATKKIQTQTVKTDALVIKQGRQLGELEIVGLSYHSNALYALTSPANVLLVIDTENMDIQQTIGLEGLNDSSGISVFNETLYVITDHEYNEPLPPLLLTQL